MPGSTAAPIGIVANNPMHLGGVLFVDSADKAARFIWLCDAFNVPLIFLADVPGFMIGSQVERDGIIRHGAKMITAVAEATVPKFSVIVRKAYGAGLYAMCGPAFDPDACLALPTAQIAVMGPDPAVNAVFYNRIHAIEDETERAEFIAKRKHEYEEDVDLVHLAAELVVDAIVQPEDLRTELIQRLELAATRVRADTVEAARRPAGLSVSASRSGARRPDTTRRAAWPESRPRRRRRPNTLAARTHDRRRCRRRTTRATARENARTTGARLRARHRAGASAAR